MKEIFVIGSYCDTPLKIRALEQLLHQAKSLGIETLVFGKYPLPERIQRLCNYFIFDRDNPFISGRSLCYWNTIHGITVSIINPDHGIAALSQIAKSLSIVNALGYDIAYWINYDVDLLNFIDFSKEARRSIESGNQVVGFEWVKTKPLENAISLTNIAFKVNPTFEKLRGSLTKTFYQRVVGANQGLFAEDVMLEAIKVSEIDYDFLDPSLNFPASITVIGDRLNGRFNQSKLPISSKYFSNFFVGFDEAANSPGFFIWNIYEHDLEVEIDFGNEIRVFSNGNSLYIRETLEAPPIHCKILSINGEPVNETLDESFSTDYWSRHRIRTEES